MLQPDCVVRTIKTFGEIEDARTSSGRWSREDHQPVGTSPQAGPSGVNA